MNDLQMSDFVRQGEIQTLVEDFLAFRTKNPEITFSDIVDEAEHEYVDLVMEGGGILGFALVGYTYFLEAVGFRFLRIGGTSAGAINALALAAMDEEHEKTKSELVLERLSTIDIKLFVDGKKGVQELIDFALSDESHLPLLQRLFPTLAALEHAYPAYGTLKAELGLNPGDKFHEWLKESILGETDTVSKLRKKMHSLPPLFDRRNGDEHVSFDESEELLKIVAADVTTESKVVFPEMARLYWEEPNEVNPADFVRASMSIPFFFRPFKREIPQDKPEIPGDEVRKNWIECVRYRGTTPKECLFVDGGIISNFPINLFHRTDAKPPRMPTFGARLSPERDITTIASPFALVGAVFNSARHTLDFDFILRHPDYEQVVTRIDTEDHNWLNFDMKTSEKYQLFRAGVKAAAVFLRGFNWEAYRQIRIQIASATNYADAMKQDSVNAERHVASLINDKK